MSYKTINELEALREKSLIEMPQELRQIYSYMKQALEIKCDPTKTQEIKPNWVYALFEAEKGNYQHLEKQRQSLIDYSMSL